MATLAAAGHDRLAADLHRGAVGYHACWHVVRAMIGAELLAIARQNCPPDMTDYRLAVALAEALRLVLPRLAAIQCAEVAGLLQQLVAQDMIRRQVRNDYANLQQGVTPYDQGITPWSR